MISNYLRWGLIIISPFYLLNLYVQSAYNYSLANYGQWLFSPSEKLIRKLIRPPIITYTKTY